MALAEPGMPTEYVDARGGSMRPPALPCKRLRGPALVPPPLPDGAIMVKLGAGCRQLPSGADSRMKVAAPTDVPHVVAVGSITTHWDTHYALHARLQGLRLVDTAWLMDPNKSASVAFQPVAASGRIILYISECFLQKHPHHSTCAEGRGNQQPHDEVELQ